jgi:BirA family transcriptional regulator, biotin operon repressor / biotin---[acetyl-CoA-carboxylase] ligase
VREAFRRYAEGGLAPLGGRRFKHVENLVLLEEVPSTNDVAKGLVEWILNESENLAPTAIIAAEQTAGRGRAGRIWTSPPGSLALSLILPWPEGPERVRLPIRIGTAVAAGLSRHFGVDIQLKWPNDLLHGRQKVGGILIEARTGEDGEGFAIVGVGLNLSSTRAALDGAGLPDASSLHLAGVPLDALAGEAPLIALLDILDGELDSPAPSLPDAFAAVSAHAPGDALTVSDRGTAREGRFAGVTEDGFLRLATGDGEETVVSGDVTLF